MTGNDTVTEDKCHFFDTCRRIRLAFLADRSNRLMVTNGRQRQWPDTGRVGVLVGQNWAGPIGGYPEHHSGPLRSLS